MQVGRLEVDIYTGAVPTVNITKHYNDSVKKTINLSEDDIYHLEFVVQEIKRQLKLP